jgi:hypothetical protein
MALASFNRQAGYSATGEEAMADFKARWIVDDQSK